MSSGPAWSAEKLYLEKPNQTKKAPPPHTPDIMVHRPFVSSQGSWSCGLYDQEVDAGLGYMRPFLK